MTRFASLLGLNRGHNNISNTIAAAKVAKAQMPNLLAIELGNEPERKRPYGLDHFKADFNGEATRALISLLLVALGMRPLMQHRRPIGRY